ncbi:MAG: helix-turn-helix domain-containing protein [Eubacteriales bacterium]|nr:helix-turn-helix domain-containing protein [Eubacteriales bacterium]MDD4421567.1 helix-turn-helix domain-containing protein [Eubacteriales bacterium]
MNTEIANRLYQYRKRSNFSQEELADKLGISRQAVSKWERAEASPDTDNLINLAKLYGVSLDDLINNDPPDIKEENKENTQEEQDNKSTEQSSDENQSAKKKSYVNIGKDGIHVEDEDESVHISFKGIHVEDNDETVHIGLDGIHVQDKFGESVYVGKDFKDEIKKEFRCEVNRLKPKWADIPIGIITVIAYILMGVYFGWWDTAWIVFFLIPIGHGIINAIRKRSTSEIPVFMIITATYFLMGYLAGSWHPGWVVFLTIPIFHWLLK